MVKEKSLTKNFLYNLIFTMFNLIFPIITLPYISRILKADGIGRINFANSILNYFLIVASLGIPIYGIREIAKYRTNKARLSKIFSEIFIINFISTLVCLAIYYSMIGSVIIFKKEYLLFLVIGINLVLNIFNIDWFYQGMEEYRYITVRSVIIKMISLILMFTFVRTKEDYLIYAFINVLGISGNNIVNVTNSRKIVDFTLKDLHFKKHLKPIFVLLVIQAAVNVYINMDTTMTGILAGEASVGFYSNSIKINKIVVGVVTSVGTILLPRLTFYSENKNWTEFKYLTNKALKVILAFSIPAMTGLYFLSGNIIKILCGPEFLPAVTTMKLLVPLVVILGVGNLFGTQVLMPLGQENKLLISVIIGAVTSFVLNLLLIPFYKENGAAISTCLTEALVMFIQIYFVLKFIRIKVNFVDIRNLLISNSVLFIILFIIQMEIKNIVLNIFLSVTLGMVSYVIPCILLKDSLTIEIFDKLKLQSLTSKLLRR